MKTDDVNKKPLAIECWRSIPSYEGLYQVSMKGESRSLNYKGVKGKIQTLKPGKDPNGYPMVVLYKNRKRKTTKVHRFVAEAFIPNPDNLPCVNHRDEDKTNNRVENLEWCTYEYNINYGTRNERQSKKMTNGKLSKRVAQKTKDGKLIKVWPSAMEVQRQTGYNNSHIGECCLGKRKSYKGFLWEFVQ